MRNDTPLTLTVAAAFLLVPLQAIPQIYKWVDEQGKTTYSSTPPPAGVKKPVVVPAPPSPAPSPAASAKPDSAIPAVKPTASKLGPQVAYTSAQLASPAPEETIWSNTGDVPFSIALQPPLQQGNKIRILLNGANHGDLLEASQGTLSSLERGSYTLQAEILDRSGKAVASTNSVTFYLQKASSQSPTRKKN